MQDAQVASLRHFARGFIQAAGSDPGSGRFAEAGILFGIAAGEGSDPVRLAANLGVPEDRVAAVLALFHARGWVTGDPLFGPIRLTATDRAAGSRLEAGTRDRVTGLLIDLSDALRVRFGADARNLADTLAGRAPGPATIRHHRPGDLGWVVERHADIYARELGFDRRLEASVARACADFLDRGDAAGEAAFLAERDGTRLGSAFVTREDGETARLRLVMLEPAARGGGTGKRLIRRAEEFARDVGYRRMVLGTFSPLLAARAIYAGTGWRLVSSHPEEGYGPRVQAEEWERVL